MNPLGYVNLAIAVSGLLMALYALRRLPSGRKPEPLICDALVLVLYLLVINSHDLLMGAPQAQYLKAVWHVFDMVVLLNILVHLRQHGVRHRR